MNEVMHAAALVVAGIGVLGAVIGALRTGRIDVGLRFGLELWTAAGLLQLTASRTWSTIGTAAAIILLRRVLSFGLASGPKR